MHNWKLNTLYVVLSPRQNIIILKILSESKRNELKCSLKLIVMFLSIIVKWQVPTLCQATVSSPFRIAWQVLYISTSFIYREKFYIFQQVLYIL